MVIELQATTPKFNNRKIYPNDEANGDASQYYRDQLAIMKENLLNPAEVTFRLQENGNRRNRLMTISSEISDNESVASSTKEKKKIPVRFSFRLIFFFHILLAFVFSNKFSLFLFFFLFAYICDFPLKID